MEIHPDSQLVFKKNENAADTLSRSKAASPAAGNDKVKNAKLHKACADFEGLVLKQLLQLMRESVPQGGLIDDSDAQKMYRTMQDEALAEKLARAGGIGIAEVMYGQISGQLKNTTGK